MSASPPVLRPLGIGEILDAGFTIYRRHFGRLLLVMLVATGPAILVAMGHMGLGWASQLVGQLAAQIGIIWIVSEIVLGAPPRDQGVLGVTLRCLVPALGLQVLVVVMIGLGMLALIVPGILLTLMTFAVIQVTVVEGDVGAALPRSWHLAKGAMGRVGLVVLFTGMINLVVGTTLQLGMNGWSWDAMVDQSFTETTLLEFALSLGVGMVIAPYSTVVMTLLYFDQRVRKDGLDVQLAADAASS